MTTSILFTHNKIIRFLFLFIYQLFLKMFYKFYMFLIFCSRGCFGDLSTNTKQVQRLFLVILKHYMD